LATRPRNLDELRSLIRSGCETRIRGWATEARLSAEDLFARLRGAFDSVREKSELDLAEAEAEQELDDIRSASQQYRSISIRVEHGLGKLPASPPPSGALGRMYAMAEAVRGLLPDDEIDRVSEAESESGRSFRSAILRAFDEAIPGLAAAPTDGHLAVLSLWLSPDNGCSGVRQEAWTWTEVYSLERRAISVARKRQGGTDPPNRVPG